MPGQPTAESQSRRLRVLVVGAGLGTNAGLGLEVPLAHGKFVSDGQGGVVPVSADARAQRRAKEGNCFPGFMGEVFAYTWERGGGYLGNAGFIYGALLRDPSLQVDMLQHAVCEADRSAVLDSLRSQVQEETIRSALCEEAKALRSHGCCATYATSVKCLLESGQYSVAVAASKGICQLRAALGSCQLPQRLGLVLLNGAEAPTAMDVGVGSFGPDFASETAWFVGHAKVRCLVATSHGAEASATLRRAVRQSAAAAVEQSVLFYTALDHRCLPNRETHSLPWSLTFPEECWFSGFGKPPRLVNPEGSTDEMAESRTPLLELVYWAACASPGQPELGRLKILRQFPGPARFAEIRMELAELGESSPADVVFRPITLTEAASGPKPCFPQRAPHESGIFNVPEDGPAYDILFDAQVSEMQVVLKDVQTGSKAAVSDILSEEGQYATRLVRFFRYYEEKSSRIRPLLQGTSTSNEGTEDVEFMIHELLAMNKNLGNFLWTGFMTPATAFSPTSRYGTDLLEVIVEVELARLGGVYRGFGRGRVDAEHSLVGHYSLTGDLVDGFLEKRGKELREARLSEFLRHGSAGGYDSIESFQHSEEQYFSSHRVKEIEGYVRRELTVDHNIPVSEAVQHLSHSLEDLGLGAAPRYRFSDFGHSTSYRFFVDGKAWLSACCQEEDFDFVRHLVEQLVCLRGQSSTAFSPLSFLVDHASLETRYRCIPGEIVPPNFGERNGYCAVAYRKFGDAGRQFNGLPGWANFALQPVDRPLQIWVPGFGPAEPKCPVFGQLKELPREIGRGGTTAKLYAYDVDFKNRSDPGAVSLRNAVQVNAACWWELQLYAMTACELRSAAHEDADPNAALNFSSQAELLRMIFRLVFEEELSAAKNLWLAGLSRDGLRKAARPFPTQGSPEEDPELQELLQGLVQANVRQQERNAENRFSMRPTNAKRVTSTGNFDPESKSEICLEFLRLVPEAAPPADEAAISPNHRSLAEVLTRQQVLTIMNRSLRHCADFARSPSAGIRAAAARTKADFCSALEGRRSGAFSDEPCLRFAQRLAQRVANYDTFSQLQSEVNAILAALPSRG